MLSVFEVVYFVLVGRRRRAKEVIDAWRWNLAPARDLDGARAAVGATRRVPDRVVLRLAARRSSRSATRRRVRGSRRWSCAGAAGTAPKRLRTEARPRATGRAG